MALIAAALAAVAYLAIVLGGKDCHYNVHLVKRIYCTDRE
jgi:hypothetical protein